MGFIVVSLLTPATCGVAWEGEPRGSGFASEWNRILSIFSFYEDNDNNNNKNHFQETKLLTPLIPKPVFQGRSLGRGFQGNKEFRFLETGKNVPFLEKKKRHY